MSFMTPIRRLAFPRSLLIVPVLGLSMLGSYGLTRALRGNPIARRPAGRNTTSADTTVKSPFASGRYLVAFVFLAAECGFCTEKGTKQAIGALRTSLQASQRASFAQVTVVGVAIDSDLGAGSKYLQSLGRSGTVFDELSLGGSWLNEPMTALAWRAGMATPDVPQVVLIERLVDATAYPRHIEVQRDSMLLKITGRDDLIAWVKQGTPLVFRRPRRAG